MRTRKVNLLIVAHPDDETIFFAGLLLRVRRQPWHIICVTDGNADGRGKQRAAEFAAACHKLKATSSEIWGLPDLFAQRLDTHALLERLLKLPKPGEVFTHGILGEYGHPHHQDVSYCVHNAFSKKASVWSLAYNCLPERVIRLTKNEYKIKTEILTQSYGHETQRFLHLLPATSSESFVRVSLNEINAVYKYFCGGPQPTVEQLKTYRWLHSSLPHLKLITDVRPF